MAQPKKKSSKSAKNMRRANWKLEAPSLAKCTNCNQPVMPHRVCPNCGYYKGKEIVAQEAAGE